MAAATGLGLSLLTRQGKPLELHAVPAMNVVAVQRETPPPPAPAASPALVMPPPAQLPTLPAALIAVPGQPIALAPSSSIPSTSQPEQPRGASVPPVLPQPAPKPAPKPPAVTKANPTHQPSKSAPPAVAAGKINVNTATQAELELLPRIGPAMAQRIIEYRTKSGAFKSVEDLDKVKGIGPKTLEKLRPLVRVE
jgi:competence protein ComEA